MTYFKAGLGLTMAERFGSPVSAESFERATGTPVVKVSQATGIATMTQIKAEWPKRTRTVTVSRDGIASAPTTITEYVWKFADGTTRYTQPWNNEYYLHVKNGTSPPPPAPKIRVPDLSNVTKGSREYFQWLCRAQGKDAPGSYKAHAVRVAFDRRGWKWKHDDRTIALPGWLPVPQDQWSQCGVYVSRTENEGYWPFAAAQYAIHKVPAFIESRKTATSREHRASECKNRVPPDQVAACEAFVSGGNTIEGFINRINSGEMSQEEFDALTVAGGGKLPGSGLFGIPIEYLAAGGVGVVLLGALLLKRGK